MLSTTRASKLLQVLHPTINSINPIIPNSVTGPVKVLWRDVFDPRYRRFIAGGKAKYFARMDGKSLSCWDIVGLGSVNYADLLLDVYRIHPVWDAKVVSQDPAGTTRLIFAVHASDGCFKIFELYHQTPVSPSSLV
jgi:hypothetical protein